jgi:hypothetical protein
MTAKCGARSKIAGSSAGTQLDYKSAYPCTASEKGKTHGHRFPYEIPRPVLLTRTKSQGFLLLDHGSSAGYTAHDMDPFWWSIAER